MRSIDRVAILLQHPEGWKWLDAGTRKQLTRRGWFDEGLSSPTIHRVPYIIIRTLPEGHFDRAKVIDAANRSLAEIVWGETHDSSYLVFAVREGMDRVYLALHHLTGMFPDTIAPAPPYLVNIDIQPDWGTVESLDALERYWRAATAASR